MEFISYKVNPKGRNKHGVYASRDTLSKQVTYSRYGGNISTEVIGDNTSSQGENGGYTPQPQPKPSAMFLFNTQGNFKGEDIALSAVTATTRLLAYTDTDLCPCYIGDIANSGATNYGISGIPSEGMIVSVIDNGSSATTLQVVVNSGISQTSGTLTIPCSMPLFGEEGMGNDWRSWNTLANEEGRGLYQLDLSWSWNITNDVSSAYILEATNEYAGVNCDADGNVLPGAVLPTCEFMLYFGENILSAATYEIQVPPAYHASGVSFSYGETGATLSFTSELAFEGTSMSINLIGRYGGLERKKVFNLTKNMPGANGEPAVTRWLVPSTTAVRYVPSTRTYLPSNISCEAWEQVGSGTPVQSSAVPMYYQTDMSISWLPYSAGTQIAVDIRAGSYYQFALGDGVFIIGGPIYDQETIPIISDGQQGAPGTAGRTGPSIRGPIDWYSGITETRRFCNGLGPLDGDKAFIDILLKDGTYYRCNTSYDATTGDSWASVSSAWTASDESYNFVATNLLLAENAKINFLTNNALQLTDDNGNVTGGMQGGSGSTIAIWAGSGSPADAPFKVDHLGNLSATTGQFGFMQIGNLQHQGSSIRGRYDATGEWEGWYNTMGLSPQILGFTSYDDHGDIDIELTIGAPTSYSTVVSDPLSIMFGSYGSKQRAIYTNGFIQASNFKTRQELPRYDKGFDYITPVYNADLEKVVFTIVTPSAITTSNCSHFFSKCTQGENTGYWVFRGTGGTRASWTSGDTTMYYYQGTSGGLSTGVKFDEYPYVGICQGYSGQPAGAYSLLGHWCFGKTAGATIYGDTVNTIWLTAQTTQATKYNHIIYLEMQ